MTSMLSKNVSKLSRMRPLLSPARRTFSEVSTDVKQQIEAKPKKKAPLGSRLRSFIAGFTVAGTLSGYALYYKVQWANEELAAMVRETAARQAQIERRLSQLDGR
ncbi:unnamed protein product [Symbiodinium necroappetens]|uniref:Uncharacterized protein n=1 Tax=Symbiodinium necroappetens TaxID=1628268 RepID=A0A812P0R9_9DINO|nr:unnamed protein product [Symbiodinium necroappetens]